ncbi:GNAT family N-acetyltransferase [Verrucomicrobiota bacterium]
MVNINRIKPDDTEDVKNFINSIMQNEFPEESSAYEYHDLDNPLEHYKGEREIFLVAKKDGQIIGTAAIKEDSQDSALLRRVFVHERYRGKGYGKMLLSKAMEFCFNQNYKNVIFRGTNGMQNALKLCIKNGFEQKDIAKFGKLDLIVLSRKLQSASENK